MAARPQGVPENIGIGGRRAEHSNKNECAEDMRISVSIETPNAFSMRSAISGDNAARSFSRADSAGRVTPNALAASVTDSSGASTISLFTNPPGCAGFFTRKPVLPSRQFLSAEPANIIFSSL
jgi:hypothetical protein